LTADGTDIMGNVVDDWQAYNEANGTLTRF
jgi:hypothetical protein